MNISKQFFGILTILLLSFTTLAQSSIEYKVSFNKENKLSSEKYELEAETENPIARITAYVLDENVEADLYYRLKSGKEWEEWKALIPFTEGHTEGRTTFDGGLIEQSFTGIQFKSSNTLAGEVVFRVYYPGSMKKKKPAGKRKRRCWRTL